MALTPIRRLAVLGLLVTQVFASGAVSFAHAREPVDAPRRIESAQHEHCPVLHDATVCVLCSFSHNRATVPTTGGVTLALPDAIHTALPAVAGPRAVSTPRSGDARAPPHAQG